MEPAAVLAVLVKAQGVGATNAQLTSVQRNLQKTESAGAAMAAGMQRSGKKVSAVGKTMTKSITLPILALGAASADFSLKFNRDMALVQDQAGASAKETAYFKRELLGLAGATKFGPDEAAAALFRVRSAGFKGAEGMAVLRQGMNLATVGNSNLEYTTKALTGAAKSLDIHGSKAFRHLAAEMNAAVGTGDMRMEELQDALSTGVLPAFVQAGMGFRDYAAALTVMTDRNVPAQVASTRLRTAITMLIPHSKKAEEALEGVGIKSEDLATIMRSKGLPAAIKFLADHLDKLSPNKANRVMIEAFGGAKSSATIEMLVQNYEELFEKEKLVGEGVKKYHHQVQNMEHNPLVQLQMAWSAIQGDLIKIGDVLVPIIVPAFIHVADAISKAVDGFGHLSPETQKLVVYVLMVLAAVGPLLKIVGFFITAGGKLVGVVVAIAGAFSTQAAAADTAAASTAAYTDSMIAAVAVQKELLIANSSGTVVGSVPVMTGAASAETAAVPAASRFASGFAKAIPFAFAAAGVVNIISSVMSGDGRGALFKTGGAIAGAIAGGLVGGLPGAMIGAGLGSFGGQIIEGLFGSAGVEKKTIDYFKQAKHSLDSLSSSGKKIREMHHQQKQAAEAVKNAESNLSEVRAKMGPHSAKTLEAEAELIHKRRTLKKLNRQLKEQEQERKGPAKEAAEIGLKHDVPKIAGQQARLMAKRNEQRWQLGNVIANYKAGLAGYDLVRKKQNELAQTSDKLKHKEKQLGNIFKEADQKISPKFANQLQKLAEKSRQLSRQKNPLAKWFDFKIRAPEIASVVAKQLAKTKHLTQSNVKDLIKTINSFPKGARGAIKNTIVQMLNEWANGHPKLESQIGKLSQTLDKETGWKKQQEAARKTSKSYEHAGKKAAAFRTELHSKMQLASTDVQGFTQAGTKGLGNFATQLNTFAGQLGIGAKHFSISGKGGKGKPAKAQTGGMIVPGGGTGDKVPLTALVEPGEIVHVLNSRASRDVKKLGALERLNRERPRFQEGGAMGGTAAAMQQAMQIDAQHFPYSWGGGHGGFSGPFDCSGAVSSVLHAGGWLQKPMVSGELASFGAAGPGPITIYANGVHAFMSIMGKFFGTSGSNPGGGAGFFPSSVGEGEAQSGDSGGAFHVRHPLGAGMIGGQVQPVAFNGPAGKLKEMGGNAMTIAQGMSNEWLKKHMPGKFGGGDAMLEGVGGPVASQAAQIAKAGHSPHISTLALFEALWAESSMGTAAPGNVLEALEPYTKIRPAAQEISGFLYGHPEWTGTTAVSLANSGLPANAIAQRVQASGVGEGNEGRANYLPQQARALASMAQFGLDAGGAFALLDKKGKGKKVKGKDDGKGKGSIAKTIKSALKGLRTGKHLPKYQAQLRRAGRSIEGIGVGKDRAARLGGMSKDVEKFAEFASGASSLTRSVEGAGGEEEVIQGVFKGRHEGEWLNEQLGALLRLRRELIATHSTVEKGQLPRVNKLMKEAKTRLNEIKKTIREAEQKKREIEKQVKEIEQASKKTKQKLEQEVNQIEHELSKAQGAKNPDKGTLETLRGEIKTRKEAMGGGDKKTHEEVKAANDQIHKIEEQNRGRKRVEGALSGTIIPDLEAKQEGMHETLSGLYENGGEIWKIPYMDLKSVQGMGSSTELDVPNPPPIGSLGGEVFTVQNRLREIQEEAEKKNLGGTGKEDETELKQIAEQIAEQYKQRYLVSQYQYGVLQGMASVQQIAHPDTLPFAGSFAKGGVMMAEVGERGREIVAAPQGSRVIPSHEARAALAKGNVGDINFEDISFHEAEGKVRGRANGKRFEQDVKDINRKQTRKSISRTPGGKGLR